MKKISVIGHFAFGHNYLDGQTVKTKILTDELQNRFGTDEVITIDTHGSWKTLIKAPFHCLRALKNSKNVIILPAHNGLRVYAPILSILRKFFKQRKLHYSVIGGWLPKFLKDRKSLTKTLKSFDAIYVETTTMKLALEDMGFTNIYVMPNCKKLTPISKTDLVYAENPPYRLCTFSRVSREKGIEDAVNAVISVNKKLGYQAFSLDIYGQIDAGQTEWFENLKNTFPEYIEYGGAVPFDKSVEVLKDYFALLFPTHYYTEGIPGTIIDAYAAGIPVISAKWESYADVIDDGITGVCYDFDNLEQFESTLFDIAKDHNTLLIMKDNCIEKAGSFIPSEAVTVLNKQLL